MTKQMTPAEQLGMKVGELYVCKVGDENGDDCSDTFYKQNMVVRFKEDDGSVCPYFTYHSGPKTNMADISDRICIYVNNLTPYNPNTPKEQPMQTNTQTTRHPYADILIAIAEGEEIELKRLAIWDNVSHETALEEVACGLHEPECFRVKPDTIQINGYDVPKPSRILNFEQDYFYVDTSALDGIGETYWSGDDYDFQRAEAGIIHLTKEAAKIHAKALLSFTKK